MTEKTEQLGQSLGGFVSRLRQSAQNLSITERQKVVRLLIKDIVVEVDNRITIRHCLPLMGGVRNASGSKVDCYPLCTGSPISAAFPVSSFLLRWPAVWPARPARASFHFRLARRASAPASR
jgi:hypothetical protein